MSQQKGVDVRIVNPCAGRGYTSLKRAKEYVRRGLAILQPSASGRLLLEFVPASSGPIAATVARSVERETEYDRAAHLHIAQLREVAGLPAVMPSVLLNFGRNTGASRSTFLAAQGF